MIDCSSAASFMTPKLYTINNDDYYYNKMSWTPWNYNKQKLNHLIYLPACGDKHQENVKVFAVCNSSHYGKVKTYY